MQLSERVFNLAGVIMAASTGVGVEQAVLVAEVIVDVSCQLGRERVLRVLTGGDEPREGEP